MTQSRTAALTERVISALNDYLDEPPATITAETRFEDLGMDSMDIVSMATDLERELDVFIPNEALFEIETIGEAVAQLEALLAKKAEDA